MDGRRHSVDIPISRTLVALRRVRSLRDPSTNSLSKFSPLVDNLNWESSSKNGIGLDYENKQKEDIDFKDNRLEGVKEQHYDNDRKIYHNSRKSNSRIVSHEISDYVGNMCSVPIRNIHAEGSNLGQQSKEMLCGNKSMSERYCSGYRNKGLELVCVTPSSDCLEGVGSCNEPNEGFTQEQRINHDASSKKCQYRKHSRSSKAAAGDVLSCVGSPCLSIGDSLLRGSSRATSLCGNEEADILDSSQCGCGISRCWSITPRLKESSLHLDAEERPLLARSAGEAHLSEQRRKCNHSNNVITLYAESPRCLTQKFKPKSFNELVGQNVVARSLLSAISNERITPFYLFHGPHGTGKTSASRLFAAALNCLSPEIDKPCGLCRECVLFFSGRSRDVKEIDSMKINRTQRVRAIIKDAENSPVSSRFKIFIIDECHLLQEDTWATIMNNIEDLPGCVVFIMITSDLHKLPRAAVSRSQRYHFPKIKEADIASWLEKICIEEGFNFDHGALDFIAAKSNGSLRDAEMMLEQLSLTGKGINMSMVYELMGVVSDDELLDLLHLALSSDTSETVKRARELMRSRIDPLQLISQLANLIMDILAGKCQENSEVKQRLLGKYTSEADTQQLSHALKVLSETEKQLRMSKNQTTWLTVALLQLNSVESLLDANKSRLCIQPVHPKDGDFCSTSSTSESLKHLVVCACDNKESCKLGMQDCSQTLESIWRRAAGMCESSSLKNFLQKRGKLLSIGLRQGLAIAELGFYHSKCVRKAEKSWKVIAGALQHALGYNVEIRILLILGDSPKDYDKSKRSFFSFFSCSSRIRHRSQSTKEFGSDPSENSNFTSGKAITREKYVEVCSSDCGSHISHTCSHGNEVTKAIRNNGNALSIAVTASHRSITGDRQKDSQPVTNLKDGRNCGCRDLVAVEPEKQPGCFSRAVKLQRSTLSNSTKMIFSKQNAQNDMGFPVPQTTISQAHLCASDPVVSCIRSDDQTT